MLIIPQILIITPKPPKHFDKCFKIKTHKTLFLTPHIMLKLIFWGGNLGCYVAADLSEKSIVPSNVRIILILSRKHIK